MTFHTVIFKIGGKILENYENINTTIAQLSQIYKEKIIKKIILIPGGGSYANFVRNLHDKLEFDEELAHWMAILSMNYNGIELNEKFPEIITIDNISKLKKLNKTFSIFLPFKFLKENDQLPHNWEVTSDSIALFLAKELVLNKCFLIKDVDGVFNDMNQLIKEITTDKFLEMKKCGKLAEIDINLDKLKTQSKPIDLYSLQLIKNFKIHCFILNGSSNTQRILDFFNESLDKIKKIFTKII